MCFGTCDAFPAAGGSAAANSQAPSDGLSPRVCFSAQGLGCVLHRRPRQNLLDGDTQKIAGVRIVLSGTGNVSPPGLIVRAWGCLGCVFCAGPRGRTASGRAPLDTSGPAKILLKRTANVSPETETRPPPSEKE